MKPIEEFADPHSDFARDESTSVMGTDLLSSLTERSRRIEVSAPEPEPLPEPEISISVDEPEPVTTMRLVGPPPPAALPKAAAQLLIVGEYPALGDEDSTMMMDEPEPTTVAVRSHVDDPMSLPEPPPAPTPAPTPAPAALQTHAEPQWVAELAPRQFPTIRVVPLPAPLLDAAPDDAPTPAVGSRRLGTLAAAALGVAAATLGLGHHQPLPASAIVSPAPAVSSAVVAPWDVQTQATAAMNTVRTSADAFWQSIAKARDASARNESVEPGTAKHRPVAARHRQRS